MEKVEGPQSLQCKGVHVVYCFILSPKKITYCVEVEKGNRSRFVLSENAIYTYKKMIGKLVHVKNE